MGSVAVTPRASRRAHRTHRQEERLQLFAELRNNSLLYRKFLMERPSDYGAGTILKGCIFEQSNFYDRSTEEGHLEIPPYLDLALARSTVKFGAGELRCFVGTDCASTTTTTATITTTTSITSAASTTSGSTFPLTTPWEPWLAVPCPHVARPRRRIPD